MTLPAVGTFGKSRTLKGIVPILAALKGRYCNSNAEVQSVPALGKPVIEYVQSTRASQKWEDVVGPSDQMSPLQFFCALHDRIRAALPTLTYDYFTIQTQCTRLIYAISSKISDKASTLSSCEMSESSELYIPPLYALIDMAFLDQAVEPMQICREEGRGWASGRYEVAKVRQVRR